MAAPVSAEVGVVVPVRAPAPYLGEALESALSQDPPPEAVVVVDNASPEPVRLAVEHAERCVLVRREQDGGPADARATGLATLATPLVALLDSDDVWERGKLALQLEVLDRHPEVDVCFGRAKVVGPNGAPTGDRLDEPAPGLIPPESMARTLFERNPIPTSSALVRRAPLEAAGGFEGAATDDWGCWMRLAESGAGFYFDPRVAIRYRRHPGGATADIAKIAKIALAVQDEHGAAVDAPTRARVRRDYLALLARGRIRQRRYAEAREALREAHREAPLRPRERALGVVAGVPGLRAALGRRNPYRE